METVNSSQKHVVVIGAGFGGMATARSLANEENVRVTIVDRRNHHLFQPLLYQVATTTLSAPEIARSVRSLFANDDSVSVLYDAAEDFDLEQKVVKLSSGNELSYDYLVMATGARTSFFGNNHWAEHVYQLKSLAGSLAIREKVLKNIELAERSESAKHNELTNIVIVGGGPTGVELAGAFADLIQRSMKRDVNNFNTETQRIILIEAQEHVLGVFHEKQSIYTKKALEKLGVEVRTKSMVENIEENLVSLKGGEQIKAGTIIWTAGVEATDITKKLNTELTRGGLVKVNANLNLPNHSDVFVIGDCCAVEHKDGRFVPGVAPAAEQGGKYAAKQIVKSMKGEDTSKPFSYFDKGKMAIIGKGCAIVDFKGMHMQGWLGWAAWLFVHLLCLVDFRSKASVLANWFWGYLSNVPGARVFTASSEDPENPLRS